MDNVQLRLAKPEDAEQLLAIYRPYVESPDSRLSNVSFEYVAPSVEEFRERIEGISAAFPYLVVEENGVAVGYAYAHPYITRFAYQWSAELTIYLASEGWGKGYGTLLYKALEQLLMLQGITNLYACIAGDNESSIGFHRAQGYTINGTFSQCAYKNDMWLDMVWMEKKLAHPQKPELIKSIKDIPKARVLQVLQTVLEEV